jgi:Ca2+-binding RTX toxin-like protein
MAGFYGSDGNDNGLAGFTEYYMGNGNDYVFGNIVGADYYMGEGNDLAFASPSMGATGSGTLADPTDLTTAVQINPTGINFMEGGLGADMLAGFDGNDVMNGGGSSDSGVFQAGNGFYYRAGLYGGTGNDYLDGDQGNDWLDGGDDNDTLVGGEGNDTLLGGDGNDLIYADQGADIVNAGIGNDVVYTGVSNVGNVNLGSGNDTFGGGNANDTVFGDTGNDVFNMGGGADLVNGAGGTDLIYGGQGSDLLFGGGDTDYFMMELDIKPGDFDYIGDFTIGGAAADYVVLPSAMNGFVFFGDDGAGNAFGVSSIGGSYYGFTVAGVTAAQLQAQTLFL